MINTSYKPAPLPARTDKSVIGAWWWSVDRWTFVALAILSVVGCVLVMAASPPVAERLGLSPFYFVYRHVAMLLPALLLMVGVSLMDRKTLWRMASAALPVIVVLMVATLFTGVEIKGGTRWIRVFGFSLQPSEFVKPVFAVVSAWLIARQQQQPQFPGYYASTGLFGMIVGLLLLQPDLGMTIVLSAIWATQIFLAGLPMIWVFVLGGMGIGGLFCAYLFFPHVTSRVDRFLDPASGDNYQVQKSLDAFQNGGLFGTGPGHGQIKFTLPDAHADFIFSVAGEEFGMLAAIVLVMLYGFIIWRCVYRMLQAEDNFIVLAAGGLIAQFALQSFVHMGSSLQILPAKGMTLPFISYGGSSLLAVGLGMGMLLSLTRKRLTTGQPGVKWRQWSDKTVKEIYGE